MEGWFHAFLNPTPDGVTQLGVHFGFNPWPLMDKKSNEAKNCYSSKMKYSPSAMN
jgi:hypothetical protein